MHKPFQSIRIEREDSGPVQIVEEQGERKTISLSSLKREPVAAKKKEPSEENVKALRDVLSSILKKPEVSPSPSASKVVQETTPTPYHTKPEVSQDRPTPTAHHTERTERHSHTHDRTEKKTNDSTQTDSKQSEAPHSFNEDFKTPRREVPEDVLKKMLSMDPVREE
jgi:hypothetical protein